MVWHLLVLKADLYTKQEGEHDLSSVTPLIFLEKALLNFCRKSPRYSSLSLIKRSRQKNVYSTVKRKVHKNPGLLPWIFSSSTLFWLFCCSQLLQWRRHKKFGRIIHRYNSLFSRDINPTLEKFPSITLNAVHHTVLLVLVSIKAHINNETNCFWIFLLIFNIYPAYVLKN